MPGGGGFAVMDSLRAELPDLHTAIIVLTGEADREARIAAYERGARDYVLKPFDIRELRARVSNAVEVQRLQRRLEEQNCALEAQVAARTARLQQAMDVLRQAEVRLQEALEKSEDESRSKSQLVAEIIHEMRTPLNAIIGFSDAMISGLFGPIGSERYGEYADHIHDAGNHLLNIVNSLLDVSKAELGADTLDLQEIDIGPLTQGSVGLLQRAAELSGVKLELKIATGPLRIRTDETKFRQVVLNMASNAIKFTPRGGSVTVEAGPDPEGGATVLIIRDTGIGIAPEDVATVMRPFGQVQNEHTRQHKGSGLGMPLTKRLVELLGGTFSLASQPGRGTVISIRFPASLPAIDPSGTQAA
jgi:signal transduction histidine kinase